MRRLVLASMMFFALSTLSAQSPSTARKWVGVWQMTPADNKPGGSITLADDEGALAGVIVFNVMSRETGQRIDIVPRMLVNPHIQGDTLVFQVRRILKPHLEGDSPDDAPDPTDIVDMTLTYSAVGKAVLTCAKCGSNSPMQLAKEE